jgi:hypothetical protein
MAQLPVKQITKLTRIIPMIRALSDYSLAYLQEEYGG